MSSEIYSEEMIREELLDEVKDLEEEMMRYRSIFPGRIMCPITMTAYF